MSVNTIQNVFRQLEATNLVERHPRRGGFVKSKPRRPVITSRATTVAVVIDHGSNAADTGSWAYRIIRGCDRTLAEAGFHTAIFSFSDDDPDALSKVLAKIDEAGATLAGVLCFIRNASRRLPQELDARDVPWVSVNPARDHAAQNFVAQDALHAGRLVGRCFARMDLPRIAMLSEPLVVGRSSSDWYLGLLQGWLERGKRSRDVDFVRSGGVDEPDGFAAIRAYLDTDGKPGAIVATGDMLALGAARAVREAGLAVGEQTHVIGATGLEIAQYSHPPLTVSQVPMERMGDEAARMLLEMAREGVRRLLGRYLPTKVIVRQSCPIPAEIIEEEAKSLAEENEI